MSGRRFPDDADSRLGDEKVSSLEQRLEELSFRRLEMSDVKRLPTGPVEILWDELPWGDQGQPARIERIWGRLQGSLRLARRRQSRRPFTALAAAAAVFALGVFLGRETVEVPDTPVELVAERIVPEQPLPLERRDVVERPGRPSAAPAPSPLRVGPRRGRVGVRRNVPPVAAPPEPSEPVLEAPTRPSPVIEVPEWLVLADRGEYAAAFQAVDQAGGFDAVLDRSNAEELMTLADVARAAGQQGRAIQTLRRVVQLHPEDPNAPVAAMMLGNLLHRAGDVVGAAEAYALNRSLSPQGDFAEDALAREFEVALEAAHLERARALAMQYEREFPQGRRLGEIREQLERAERELLPGEQHREDDARGEEEHASDDAAPRAGRGSP